MDTVSILKCSEYDLPLLRTVIGQSFDNIGGIGMYVKQGSRVLVKPNLLMKKRPGESVTTHNLFVQALVEIVMEAGGKVTIADSPGGLYNANLLRGVYRMCGMEEVAAATGAVLNYDAGYKQVDYPQGIRSKAFPIINPVPEADVIINVPKLKTHMMMFYSGAVKNMFGAIPGVYKAEYHFSMPDSDGFCDMLLDLCACTAPTISIIDGIWGMEGQGPSSGIPRKFGVVLASASPYALDVVATNLMGITPSEAPTVARSIQRGLCGGFDEIQLTGDNIETLRIDDLIKPPIGTPDFIKVLPFMRPFSKQINHMLSPIPAFDRNKCVACGECVACCPAKALSLKDKRVVLQKKKCIRCFCCQELCPKKAVDAKRGRLMRLVLNH